ncbi:DoxX family protein [Deinococcus aerophilus]|uniref:DoxX family protein n=1 Tax=Deinococcus aerophilus TaxID=522488 RepID=A0ABQ2GMH1_9DEIO|nr:DoxX family protein [Deinococcus aerophilus]GGM02322.1 hypothetical protein GCM10010841_08560 [Deinococcus aerophilus]
MKLHPDAALALVRITVGLIFAWHGFERIFEVGLGRLTADAQAAGVPLPLLTVPLAAVLELVGGPLLALGLGARGLAGTLAAMTLLLGVPPLLMGRWPEPAALQVMALLVVGSVAVVLGGPGRPALRDRSRPVLPASALRRRRPQG